MHRAWNSPFDSRPGWLPAAARGRARRRQGDRYLIIVMVIITLPVESSPGARLHAKWIIPLNWHNNPVSESYYHPHFTDENAEALRVRY